MFSLLIFIALYLYQNIETLHFLTVGLKKKKNKLQYDEKEL